MRYGMNLLLWTEALTDDVLPLLERLKHIGFDAVELPLFEYDTEKCARIGKYCDDVGLMRTAVTVRGAEDNPISPDPKSRRKGLENNKAAVECCQAAGVNTLVGPFHSGLGCFTGAGPTSSEWNWAVEAISQVAEYADRCGVTLALECLNRFECYLLNTTSDGVRFCKEVNHPRCKMMYDTFHAHIEEKNTAAAIHALRHYLAHVHISENDRSTPGTGSVRWTETFDALRDIGYDDLMVIEAFGVTLKSIIPATKIWRRMYENEFQLAEQGLKFMKDHAANRANTGRSLSVARKR